MQTDGRLCHLTLAFLVVGASKQQGRFAPRTLLRFIAITGPAATLSPFHRFPGVTGYTASLCSADFAAGRGGLLQLLGASLSSCCRYNPAGVVHRLGQIFDSPYCLRPIKESSASGVHVFEAIHAFTFVTAR